MVSKYFVLSCLLLQGLVAMAGESSQVSLNKSNGALRRSQGDLLKSEDISTSRQNDVKVALYYTSPCSRRLSDVKRDMMPVPASQYYSDCP